MSVLASNDLSIRLGIHRVKKLYLQLLYRCNFACLHCFHGEALFRKDCLSVDSAINLIAEFAEQYRTETLCVLGGEPLLYRDLPIILEFAKNLKLKTEICTNGYRRSTDLERALHYLDMVRVSLDGNESVHDRIRRPGSFAAALHTLKLARTADLKCGITMTLMKQNVRTITDLHALGEDLGIDEIVVHRLRSVGNAATYELVGIGASDAIWLKDILLNLKSLKPLIKVDSDILALLGEKYETGVVDDGAID
jgi:MoaA/NifB/PqqE/SkfB family radical SAM enzyme